MHLNLPALKVGCVGLGELGFAIAQNLLDANFSVTGYRRSPMDAFAAAGGIPGRSPAEVAGTVDVIVTCLPSVEALDAVFQGPGGILAGARPGLTIIDVTTAPLPVKERLHKDAAGRGATMLDCPLSGRPGAVRARQAAMFVSGDDRAVAACRPVLEAITANRVKLGPFGSGTRMKFIANLLVAIHVMAAAEAVELGAKTGFSVEHLLDALGDSAAASKQLPMRARAIAAGPSATPTTASTTFLKDMRVIDGFVKEVGGVAPLFSTALAYLERAADAGYGGQDSALMFSSVLRDTAAARAIPGAS